MSIYKRENLSKQTNKDKKNERIKERRKIVTKDKERN